MMLGNKVFDNAVNRVMFRSLGSISFMLVVVIALEQGLSIENLWLSAGVKMVILTVLFGLVFFLLRRKFIISVINSIKA